MHARMLGAISADQQSALNATEAGLEELHAQAYANLISLADQGWNTSAFKAELDDLATQIHVLRSDIQLMPPDDPNAIGAWGARATALDARLRNLLARTGAARSSAPELAQLRGLVYLLVAAAGAGAVGYWVYKHRRTARRR